MVPKRLYTVDRMANTLVAKHPLGQRLGTVPPGLPATSCYDRGCDLVEAAAAIRQLAGDPPAARAVPAVLGCLDTVLHELSGACAVMEETMERATQARQRTGSKPAVAARMRRVVDNLERALFDAEGTALRSPVRERGSLWGARGGEVQVRPDGRGVGSLPGWL